MSIEIKKKLFTNSELRTFEWLQILVSRYVAVLRLRNFPLCIALAPSEYQLAKLIKRLEYNGFNTFCGKINNISIRMEIKVVVSNCWPTDKHAADIQLKYLLNEIYRERDEFFFLKIISL